MRALSVKLRLLVIRWGKRIGYLAVHLPCAYVMQSLTWNSSKPTVA